LIGTEPIELYSEERLREFEEAEADLAAVLNRDRTDKQIAVTSPRSGIPRTQSAPAPTIDLLP